MSFWVKTNRLVKWIFPKYVWDIPNSKNKVFLTFDDGPTPDVTEWTLEQLKKYDAKATFFCIGNNIKKHPEIFQKILQDHHAIGNHTFNHLKGWDTRTDEYAENVALCNNEMSERKTQNAGNYESAVSNLQSDFFRPPYGKIRPSQSRALRKLGYRIVMWDVLSYDFDQTVTPEKCLENVLKNVKSGSIIVFHDSLKAEQNLRFVLPQTLAFLKENGFICAGIE